MVMKTAYARDVTDIDNERTEVKLGTGSQANLIRVCTGDMMGRPAWMNTQQARELQESLAEAIWLADQFDPETDTYSNTNV